MHAEEWALGRPNLDHGLIRLSAQTAQRHLYRESSLCSLPDRVE